MPLYGMPKRISRRKNKIEWNVLISLKDLRQLIKCEKCSLIRKESLEWRNLLWSHLPFLQLLKNRPELTINHLECRTRGYQASPSRNLHPNVWVYYCKSSISQPGRKSLIPWWKSIWRKWHSDGFSILLCHIAKVAKSGCWSINNYPISIFAACTLCWFFFQLFFVPQNPIELLWRIQSWAIEKLLGERELWGARSASIGKVEDDGVNGILTIVCPNFLSVHNYFWDHWIFCKELQQFPIFDSVLFCLHLANSVVKCYRFTLKGTSQKHWEKPY